MLSVLAGHHPSDPSSIDLPVPDYLSPLTGDLTGVRIGIDRLSRVAGDLADPALGGVLDGAVEALESLGAEIVEVELPFYNEMTAAAIVIMVSEALAYHLPDLQTRWLDYFSGTRAMVGSGALYSAADYVQAQRARRVGQKALAELYQEVDVVLTPTSSAGAMNFSELEAMLQGVGAGGFFGPVHTPYWDTTGNPVLSIPVGYTAAGLPLGLQVAGRPFDEPTVLAVGDAFQRVTDWHLQVPPLVAEALTSAVPAAV
jgi:aspartyl-tRNA(Asn)/glutamyl-tRNA(Gln) amidotransferase subunit A